MSDSKKYYYLKLKDNFFESDELKILQSYNSGKNEGYVYSDILLKMYLKSLRGDGMLIFKDRIPYNPEMLATVTNHNVGEVKDALDKFKALGLVEVLNSGEIFMKDVQLYVGKSSTEAERVRAYRNKLKEAKKLQGVQMYDKRTPEIRDKRLENRDKNNIYSSNQNNVVSSEPQKNDFESEFEDIWKDYPNKSGKKQALKHYVAWRKESKEHTNAYLFERLRLYKKDLSINTWKHPMNGSTWFNGRFDDEFDTKPKPQGKPVYQKETLPDWAQGNQESKAVIQSNSEMDKEIAEQLKKLQEKKE